VAKLGKSLCEASKKWSRWFVFLLPSAEQLPISPYINRDRSSLLLLELESILMTDILQSLPKLLLLMSSSDTNNIRRLPPVPFPFSKRAFPSFFAAHVQGSLCLILEQDRNKFKETD